LKNIIISCNENKIEAHIHIQKMGNAFLNVQQMLAQLTTYIVLSIPLYHASKTFKFSNTSPLQEHAFVLKLLHLKKTLPLDFIYIMCLQSLINTSKDLIIYLTFLSLNLLQIVTLQILGKKGKNLI